MFHRAQKILDIYTSKTQGDLKVDIDHKLGVKANQPIPN